MDTTTNNLDVYRFIREDLLSRGGKWRERYKSADPFAHVIIDDFLPTNIAEKILSLFPNQEFSGFKQPDFENHQVKKLGLVQKSYFDNIDSWLRDTLFHFNSLVFIDFLEKVTGINGLIPDPHFSGGAFHQILPGGKLGIHADFNIDKKRRLKRRINVLIYFNQNWRDEYHGHLELWDKDMKTCVHKIAPIFNRCVIFNTSSSSYHGHPIPLACPQGMTRKSIALYYYTSDPTAFDDQVAHSTLWR